MYCAFQHFENGTVWLILDPALQYIYSVGGGMFQILTSIWLDGKYDEKLGRVMSSKLSPTKSNLVFIIVKV